MNDLDRLSERLSEELGELRREVYTIAERLDEAYRRLEHVLRATEGAPSKRLTLLLRSVDELELTVRAVNCLQNADVMLVGELYCLPEWDLLRLPRLGRKTAREIIAVVRSLGMGLERGKPLRLDEYSAIRRAGFDLRMAREDGWGREHTSEAQLYCVNCHQIRRYRGYCPRHAP